MDPWLATETQTPFRYWEAPRRVIDRVGRDDVDVYVAVLQRVDRSIEPEIVVHQLHADEPIKSAAAARQLALALIEAADELDSLT